MNPYDDNRDDLLTGLCDDCGGEYVTRADDVATVCDPCADRRAAWATVTELRMAKASASADAAKAVA
jgi:hypothetical protein